MQHAKLAAIDAPAISAWVMIGKNGVPREGDLLEQAVPVVAPPDCACLKLSCRSFHGRRSQERIASTQQRFE
jgi:hypothetical protein